MVDAVEEELSRQYIRKLLFFTTTSRAMFMAAINTIGSRITSTALAIWLHWT